jgi:hypothetical protein
VNSSYDQQGRMQGAQLASIPVQVPANDVQVWGASYDDSVPCGRHDQSGLFCQ